MGKITVIKSLALPLLIQSLTVLPNPPKEIIDEIEKTFFSFLWNNKPDKIKRRVIINNYDKGGLKMPHIESFSMSLKITWINKLLDPTNISPWKTLLMDKYTKLGGDKIWMMNDFSLGKIARHFNIFWQDIFMNWGKLRKNEINEKQDVLSQSIWFNEKLKIHNKLVFYEKWCEAGIFFINDLLDENNEIFSFEKFIETYSIDTIFLTFNGILHMIPKEWKENIHMAEKIPYVTCSLFEQAKRNKKCCQFFYQQYLSLIAEIPEKQHLKWQELLEFDVENWDYIHKLPFKCTRNNKLSIFQYKILHRILATNSFLYKCHLKETHMCTFCTETKETILHLFWECNIVRNLWLEIVEEFKDRCNLEIPVSSLSVILGSEDFDLSVNFYIVLIKYYIYSCKLSGTIPTAFGVRNMLKQTYNMEILSATMSKTPAIKVKIENKWSTVKNMIL